jgi:hypothetical protein
VNRKISEIVHENIRVQVEAEPLEIVRLGQPNDIPNWLDVQKVAEAAIEEYKRQKNDASVR